MRCVGSKQIQMDLERSHLIMVEGLEARSWFTMFLLDPCCSESVCAIKWYQENADADALSKLFTRVDKAQRLARMSQEGNSRVLNYIQKLSNAIRIPLKPIHPMNTKLHRSLLLLWKNNHTERWCDLILNSILQLTARYFTLMSSLMGWVTEWLTMRMMEQIQFRFKIALHQNVKVTKTFSKLSTFAILQSLSCSKEMIIFCLVSEIVLSQF